MHARWLCDAQVNIGNEKECVKSESYLEGEEMSPLYRRVRIVVSAKCGASLGGRWRTRIRCLMDGSVLRCGGVHQDYVVRPSDLC